MTLVEAKLSVQIDALSDALFDLEHCENIDDRMVARADLARIARRVVRAYHAAQIAQAVEACHSAAQLRNLIAELNDNNSFGETREHLEELADATEAQHGSHRQHIDHDKPYVLDGAPPATRFARAIVDPTCCPYHQSGGDHRLSCGGDTFSAAGRLIHDVAKHIDD